MNDKSVNIIVLNWNQKKLSLECLNSLQKTTYKNKRIVFVDNGSDDGSVDAVQNLFTKVEKHQKLPTKMMGNEEK